MLKRLALFALVALFSATWVAPTVFAGGDDAEKLQAERQKVRDKYEKDKGGFTFYDLVYWVDVEKLEDSRWSTAKINDPKHDRQLQLHANWTNEASAVAGMNIKVLVHKLLHEEREGSTRRPFSYPFNNLGKSVPCSDMDDILEGFYEDWKRGAKDVIEDECVDPKKCRYKVPKLQAMAVGTDPESEQRERREWYAWMNGKEKATYLVEIRYGTALWDKEGLWEKGGDFMKNLKEIRESVDWDDKK